MSRGSRLNPPEAQSSWIDFGRTYLGSPSRYSSVPFGKWFLENLGNIPIPEAVLEGRLVDVGEKSIDAGGYERFHFFDGWSEIGIIQELLKLRTVYQGWQLELNCEPELL